MSHDDNWCQVDPCPDCIEEHEERERDRRERVEKLVKGLLESITPDKKS